jgi:lysophospholipase L1-like esterase
MQKNWAKTQTILSDFGKATRANGQRLIIVILPAIYQVYNSAWDEYIRALKLDPTRYDLEKPQKVLMEFCKAEGIECVDALPALRAGATNAGLYFPVDGHPTAAGHKVIAEAIREYLLGNAAKPVALR